MEGLKGLMIAGNCGLLRAYGENKPEVADGINMRLHRGQEQTTERADFTSTVSADHH
jgi:hypothetical protein